ncbi:unnamed protein product [Ceratitis capitata]|uniref:(Mediterranean fruit fly) hypothetical protein n=1 Tax=Ceratitis capitata TaxID=7213 RepID=A0A811V856_CERCA|nr:unnamed protein product [Ceratitis capitata]
MRIDLLLGIFNGSVEMGWDGFGWDEAAYPPKRAATTTTMTMANSLSVYPYVRSALRGCPIVLCLEVLGVEPTNKRRSERTNFILNLSNRELD